MATLTGIYKPAVVFKNPTGYSTPILESKSRMPNARALWAPTANKVGTDNNGAQPVQTPSRAVGGGRATSYLNDYYYRTHIVPAKIDVGNILSTQLKTVEVWNAHFVPNQLTSITEQATDGITLSNVASPPLTYQGLQSRVYTVSISTNGPATINAKFSYDFTLDSYNPLLNIVGLRVLAWWPRPNWDTPLLERWEWLTNVMTSTNRKEQRVKLRGMPRRSLEYATVIKSNSDRQKMENLLFSWQSRTFGLPMWFDQEFLQADLAAGQINIPCTTATRDYHIGGLVALLNNESDFEIGTITNVGANSVTVNTPIAKTWPTGSKVVPMRTARLTANQKFVRVTDSLLSLTVQFSMLEGDDTVPVTEATTYRTYPVLEVRPNWREEINSEYQRDINLLDFATGAVLADDTSGTPVAIHQYHWQAGTRAQISTLKKFLFARYGKWKPIWVPTFIKDLVLTDLAASSSSVMYVEGTEYTRNIALAVQRRDIRIQLTNGTLIYRRILSSTEEGAKERIVVDSAFGTEIRPDNVAEINFMTLSRLEADSIEVKWETDSIMEISTAFRSLRDDA